MELIRWCYFTRTPCPDISFLRGYQLRSQPTLHGDEDGGWLPPKPDVRRVMCRAPVFFFLVGLLSWGSGSGFRRIFQGSTTAISQAWHPSITLTEWQDAPVDCHVLHSAEPLSSRGCHQGSTSSGIATLLLVCVYVWGAHEHSLFFISREQHKFVFWRRWQFATLHSMKIESGVEIIVHLYISITEIHTCTPSEMLLGDSRRVFNRWTWVKLKLWWVTCWTISWTSYQYMKFMVWEHLSYCLTLTIHWSIFSSSIQLSLHAALHSNNNVNLTNHISVINN